MNKELMAINMVKDGKPTTVTMDIVDLVIKIGINDPFLDMILKQGRKLNLRNDAKGAEFVVFKHDELEAYVNANKKDGTTLEELKVLISGWIEEQDRIADQMVQVEDIETDKQSEGKNMDATLIKTGTLETGITDLLDTVGLKKGFRDLIFKQATARGMQAREGKEFTFSQLDTLKAYVNANKKDGTTLEELKALISGWIAEQDRIADQMEQVEDIETDKQSEVKI